MPLTPVTPVGGSIKVGVVTIPDQQWEGNWTGPLADVTQTDGAGGSSFRGFVQVPEWSFTLFYDTTDAAVAAGLVFGAVVTIEFLLGGSGLADIVTGTTVAGVRRVLDAKGETAIGVTITGKGGTVALGQAA